MVPTLFSSSHLTSSFKGYSIEDLRDLSDSAEFDAEAGDWPTSSPSCSNGNKV